MFGHGSRNCHRTVVCPACAGNHDLPVCTLNQTQRDGPVVYKYFNCSKRNLNNVNHKADDPKCPCRQDYMQMRNRVTNKISCGTRCVYEYYIEPDDFPQAGYKNKGLSSRSAVDNPTC